MSRLIYSNTVHRHEPPITNDPILVLHKDEEREFVVISKPGSIVGFTCGAQLTLVACARDGSVFSTHDPGNHALGLWHQVFL